MYSRVAVIRHTTNWVVPARLLRWRMLARAKMDYGNERIVTRRRGRAQLCRCLWHASKLILRARSSLLAMAFKAELGGPPRPPGPQPARPPHRPARYRPRPTRLSLRGQLHRPLCGPGQRRRHQRPFAASGCSSFRWTCTRHSRSATQTRWSAEPTALWATQAAIVTTFGRRAERLLNHPLAAPATKALAFLATLDPTHPGVPLPWQRQAATMAPAGLRLLLGADATPLAAERGRNRHLVRAARRRCVFCTTAVAVENAPVRSTRLHPPRNPSALTSRRYSRPGCPKSRQTPYHSRSKIALTGCSAQPGYASTVPADMPGPSHWTPA